MYYYLQLFLPNRSEPGYLASQLSTSLSKFDNNYKSTKSFFLLVVSTVFIIINVTIEVFRDRPCLKSMSSSVLSNNSSQQITRPEDGPMYRDRNVAIKPCTYCSVRIQTLAISEYYDSDNYQDPFTLLKIFKKNLNRC